VRPLTLAGELTWRTVVTVIVAKLHALLHTPGTALFVLPDIACYRSRINDTNYQLSELNAHRMVVSMTRSSHGCGLGRKMPCASEHHAERKSWSGRRESTLVCSLGS